MRIATWNVNSLKARLDRLLEWTRARGPDVLCMRETKITDEAVPADAFHELGYELTHHGLGRWNGVAIAPRIGLEDVTAGMGPAPDGGRTMAAGSWLRRAAACAL